MTNTVAYIENTESYDSMGFQVVDGGYFGQRVHEMAEKYRDSFPGGWTEFLAKHSKGETDPNNYDFDEWAFVCDHYIQTVLDTSPPMASCSAKLEGPESISGLSLLWRASSLVFPEGLHGEPQRRQCGLHVTWDIGSSTTAADRLGAARAVAIHPLAIRFAASKSANA